MSANSSAGRRVLTRSPRQACRAELLVAASGAQRGGKRALGRRRLEDAFRLSCRGGVLFLGESRRAPGQQGEDSQQCDDGGDRAEGAEPSADPFPGAQVLPCRSGPVVVRLPEGTDGVGLADRGPALRSSRSCAEGSRDAERRMASSLSLRNFSQMLSGSVGPVGSGAVTVPAHLPSGRIRGPADGQYAVSLPHQMGQFTPGRRSGDRPSARLPHTIIAQCKMRAPVHVSLHGEALPALEPQRIWMRRVHETGNASPGLGEIIVAPQEEGAAGYGSLCVSGQGVTYVCGSAGGVRRQLRGGRTVWPGPRRGTTSRCRRRAGP